MNMKKCAFALVTVSSLIIAVIVLSGRHDNPPGDANGASARTPNQIPDLTETNLPSGITDSTSKSTKEKTNANRPPETTSTEPVRDFSIERQIHQTTNAVDIQLFLAQANDLAVDVIELAKRERVKPRIIHGKAFADYVTNGLKYSTVFFASDLLNLQQVQVSGMRGNSNAPIFKLSLHRNGTVFRFEKENSVEGIGTYSNGLIDYYYKNLPDAKVYRVQFDETGKLVGEAIRRREAHFKEGTMFQAKPNE
jgi:hypothetical protein